MKKEKLLIVDDNPRNIQVLGNLLEKNDYISEYALSGAEALQWIKNSSFNLILLDVMMPLMDGFDVCTEIKKIPGKSEIPIIFITARTDIESIEKGFDVGGVDYITKPFNEKELLARVRTHVELKYARDRLEIANSWLEEQVVLRTSQLHEAYNKLEEVNNQLEMANTELENLDLAKNEFINILSHEIRTPLNGILAPLDMLKERAYDESTERLFMLLDLSVDRLEKFSLRALQITKLRSKHYKLNLSKFLITDLIYTCIDDLEKQIQNKKVDIDVKYSNNNIKVNADFDLIRMAINQIIENAINFSNEFGIIKLNILQNNSDIHIEVIDSGTGFSDKALKNIFKPFGMGVEHVNSNVGLGLHLVKLIADMHKAKVSGENNPDGGAKIMFVLNSN